MTSRTADWARERETGALLALSLIFLTLIGLVFAARSLGNTADQTSEDVQISDHSASTLTVTEEELLPVFPEVEGDNLEKRSFRLPWDFEGQANLVFVAFRRSQQVEVETWLPFAKRLVETHPGLRFYELPTLSNRVGLARYFIDNGMRRGIPDRRAREVTIPLYLEKEAFLGALDIENEASIHVLLVGREGRIHWRAEGPLTEESAAGLERALARRLRAGERGFPFRLADAAPLLEFADPEE
jgi:hypothetical protein